MWFLIWLLWAVIWGLITRSVSKSKGNEGGFWWGFFLGFIGLIIVLCKSDNHKYTYNDSYTTIDDRWICNVSASSVSSPNATYSSYVSFAAKEENEKALLADGGWKCNKCGRINPKYTGTCVCGNTQNGQEEQAKIAAEQAKAEAEAKEKDTKEILALQKLKAYKDLLDSGVISSEEFEQKKAELLW